LGEASEEIMNPRPLVSIVVNNYNGEKYLAECLDSILALEGDFDKQVIVIDDASTDRSTEIIDAYRKHRIFEFIVNSKNIGAAASINAGFFKARGEFFARIDYDDKYHRAAISIGIDALRRHPKASLVCGGVQMIDSDGKHCGLSSPVMQGHEAGSADRFHELLEHYFVTAPTVVARAAAWRKALPLPEGLNFADWYMTLAMCETGELCVLDEVLADYRVHPQNMHSAMVTDRSGETMTWRILEHFTKNSSRAHETAAKRNAIFARHWKEWGDRYFGAKMFEDARRCYWRALRLKPSTVGARTLRRLGATYLEPERYERLKSALGAWRAK
jgi:glycosyltransferase involved in cell wall biosynthesis